MKRPGVWDRAHSWTERVRVFHAAYYAAQGNRTLMARLLGISRSRVSEIMNGAIPGFPLPTLFENVARRRGGRPPDRSVASGETVASRVAVASREGLQLPLGVDVPNLVDVAMALEADVADEAGRPTHHTLHVKVLWSTYQSLIRREAERKAKGLRAGMGPIVDELLAEADAADAGDGEP